MRLVPLLALIWVSSSTAISGLRGQAPGVPESAGGQSADTESADTLYAARERLPNALAAAAQWERRLAANADDFEAAWKLARACYWLGSHVPEAERRKRFEQGIAAAEHAATLRPERPDGHFWTAANMGAMAEGFGVRAGLRYRGPIKVALERSLAIDPAYLDGSADRALGRWYAKVPRLFGGSNDKSVEHLQRSLTYYPSSVASHFFLAETFLEMNRKDDARRELQAVVSAPFHPDWTPEEKEFKQKAAAHLARLR